MNSALANPYDFRLKRFLGYSGILHAALGLLIVLGAYLDLLGNRWSGVSSGGSGDNVRVNLVSSAGLPMPKPNVPDPTPVADPSKRLYDVEPPKIEQPPPDATTLPKFKNEKPLPPSPKSKVFKSATPPPDNAVPGRGGQPNLPTGYRDSPGAPSSGVAIGDEAGGSFATRYGWYIAAVKRRIDPNWDRFSIDVTVRNSSTIHSAVSFTISRDGTVHNVRIVEPSGNLSWDNAGIRAILSSSPLPPLPSDYNHPEVSVTWDFPELKKP
jgi:TonB family protein